MYNTAYFPNLILNRGEKNRLLFDYSADMVCADLAGLSPPSF